MMNINLNILLKKLKNDGVDFKLLSLHTTAISSTDVEKVWPGNPNEIWKTLLVTDENDFFAAFICGRDRLDLNKLATALGKQNLRMAKAKELKEKLKILPGEVCPLSVNVPLVCDSFINSFGKVNFGSGDMEYGIEMKVNDILKFLNMKVMSIKEG